MSPLFSSALGGSAYQLRHQETAFLRSSRLVSLARFLATAFLLLVVAHQPRLVGSQYIAVSRCDSDVSFSSNSRLTLAEDYLLETIDAFVDWGCRPNSAEFPSYFVTHVRALTEYDSDWNAVRTVSLKPADLFNGSVSISSTSQGNTESFALVYSSVQGPKVHIDWAIIGDDDPSEDAGEIFCDVSISNWTFDGSGETLVLELNVATVPVLQADTAVVSTQDNVTTYAFDAGTLGLSNTISVSLGNTTRAAGIPSVGQLLASRITNLPTLVVPIAFARFPSNETVGWRYSFRLSDVPITDSGQGNGGDDDDDEEKEDVIAPTMGIILMTMAFCWMTMAVAFFLVKFIIWLLHHAVQNQTTNQDEREQAGGMTWYKRIESSFFGGAAEANKGTTTSPSS